MNELPRVPQDEEYQRRVGVEAVQSALQGTNAVEIALYVNGRMVSTTTDVDTVQRILRILTGLGD